MASPTTRYPFATPNGNYIPSSILKIPGIYKKAFVASPGTVVDILPAGTEIVNLLSDTDCFVRFENAVAVVPTSATASIQITNTLVLKANIPRLVGVPNLFYSVIGATASGVLLIELITKWNALALDVQYQRT